MHFEDTICAPATGNGGAVAMIRISGPEALTIVDKVISFKRGKASDAAGWTLKFGIAGNGLDEVVTSIYRAPHSYTGDDSVELSCHASPYIVSELTSMLVAAGARMAEAGEFTRRAFLSGKMDLAQAEAVADVIASGSQAEHRVAMTQMKGAYSARIRSLRDRILELSALLELELDFSEEEVEFADRERLVELCTEAAEHCGNLAASFRLGNAIKNGIPVAIAGAPNSGKSTLLNALLGDDRAIVSDIPGTTRDTVEETFVAGGIKFRLIDTAGIRESSDTIEKMGIERSIEALRKAYLILYVQDCSQPCNGLLREIRLQDGQKLINVWNKSDLCGDTESGVDGDAPGYHEVDHDEFCSCKLCSDTCHEGIDGGGGWKGNCDSCGKEFENGSGIRNIRISALTGEGLPALLKAMTDSVREKAASYDRDILVTNARHAATLSTARDSLNTFLSGLQNQLPGDLLAEDLRAAISSLNEILGEDLITPQETLNLIFKRFCIGK